METNKTTNRLSSIALAGLMLSGNTTVVYTFMWIDLKDGPMVMETPPNVLGIIDDAWFH